MDKPLARRRNRTDAEFDFQIDAWLKKVQETGPNHSVFAKTVTTTRGLIS